jgi:hypothetical protein
MPNRLRMMLRGVALGGVPASQEREWLNAAAQFEVGEL